MQQDITTWIEPFDPSNKCRGPLIGHSKMKPGDTPDKQLARAKRKQAKKARKQRERAGL